jgi:ribosomal protein S18 acetylase RimI-like enzyme
MLHRPSQYSRIICRVQNAGSTSQDENTRSILLLSTMNPLSAHSGAEPLCHSRMATEADIPRLLPLINTAYAVEDFFDGTRTTKEQLAANLCEGKILIAEDDSGKILGCIYLENRGERGYLGQFAVAPTCQRRGIGRWIFSAAEEYLRSQGCNAVDLSVLNRRTELPSIYRRFGYVETRIEGFDNARTVLFGPPCHSIVMSKEF